jgi:hypothetical protein
MSLQERRWIQLNHFVEKVPREGKGLKFRSLVNKAQRRIAAMISDYFFSSGRVNGSADVGLENPFGED